MLLTEQLILSKAHSNAGKIYEGQRVLVKCDECFNTYESVYRNLMRCRQLYGKDYCRSCKQKIQYKQGRRDIQAKKFGEYAKTFQKGKSFEELYGLEKANKLKQGVSSRNTGEKNPNSGAKYSHGFGDDYLKALMSQPLETRVGKQRALEIKAKLSKAASGKNNPMYGKPSPTGSGNGWSGWYKGWYFRSLLELSYMINVIEAQGLSWESGEQKQYRIPYELGGVPRNYYCDFVIGAALIEIKPKNLKNMALNLIKRAAAEAWCTDHGFQYLLILSDTFTKLSEKEIADLRNTGVIKFLPRYEEKYKKRYGGECGSNL